MGWLHCSLCCDRARESAPLHACNIRDVTLSCCQMPLLYILSGGCGKNRRHQLLCAMRRLCCDSFLRERFSAALRRPLVLLRQDSRHKMTRVSDFRIRPLICRQDRFCSDRFCRMRCFGETVCPRCIVCHVATSGNTALRWVF